MVDDPCDRRGSFLKKNKLLNCEWKLLCVFFFVGLLIDVDFSDLCGSYIFICFSLRQRIVKFGYRLDGSKSYFKSGSKI